MDSQKIINQLDKIYGSGRGMKVYMTVMPGILADFDKMLKGTPVGVTISELYNLDDKRCTLSLTGKRTPSGQEISIEVKEQSNRRMC